MKLTSFKCVCDEDDNNISTWFTIHSDTSKVYLLLIHKPYFLSPRLPNCSCILNAPTPLADLLSTTVNEVKSRGRNTDYIIKKKKIYIANYVNISE